MEDGVRIEVPPSVGARGLRPLRAADFPLQRSPPSRGELPPAHSLPPDGSRFLLHALLNGDTIRLGGSSVFATVTMTQRDRPVNEQILDQYRALVQKEFPVYATSWPLLSGHNAKAATFGDWLVVLFLHTGDPVMTSYSGMGELPQAIVGEASLTSSNREIVRERIERHYQLKPRDAVILVAPGGQLGAELPLMLKRHEHAMGLLPMKIFLSHKGTDKALARRYHSILRELGFDPWLDEDAMSAGTELERGILLGFRESCAAVFFVTPNFADENFLATEVDYAIAEKRSKLEKFSIITLVFEHSEKRGVVPDLLRRYVWKEPSDELTGLREILRALPVRVGDVRWRS